MKRVFAGLTGVFLLLQFFHPKQEAPAVDPGQDFFDTYTASSRIKALIVDACYDCHSNQTDYPLYAKIAPVSWWITGHVDHGRSELNLSQWQGWSAHERSEILEVMALDIKRKKMPLPSYTWLHPEARWTEEEKETVIGFLKDCYKKEKAGVF